MTESPEQYGDDGYGPSPSAEVAEVRDEFLVWPRPHQNPDSGPTK